VMELAHRLADGLGPALGADLATARHLAWAAAQGAMGNVKADLRNMAVDPQAEAIRIAAGAALSRALPAPGG